MVRFRGKQLHYILHERNLPSWVWHMARVRADWAKARNGEHESGRNPGERTGITNGHSMQRVQSRLLCLCGVYAGRCRPAMRGFAALNGQAGPGLGPDPRWHHSMCKRHQGGLGCQLSSAMPAQHCQLRQPQWQASQSCHPQRGSQGRSPAGLFGGMGEQTRGIGVRAHKRKRGIPGEVTRRFTWGGTGGEAVGWRVGLERKAATP